MIFINISRHYRLTVCWFRLCLQSELDPECIIWVSAPSDPFMISKVWQTQSDAATRWSAGVKWSWEFLTENLRNLLHIVSRSFTLKHESYSVFWFWMLTSLNICDESSEAPRRNVFKLTDSFSFTCVFIYVMCYYFIFLVFYHLLSFFLNILLSPFYK